MSADLDDGIDLCGTPCPNCHASTTYTRSCDSCGGEGTHDLYEEDPVFYHPGEWERCGECYGNGGHHWCRACGYDFAERRVICAAEPEVIAAGTEKPC